MELIDNENRPTIYTISSSGTPYDVSINVNDVSTMLNENSMAIYEREYVYFGLTLQTDSSGNDYIEVPSINYFHPLPKPNTLDKFCLASEKVESIIDTSVYINSRYQNFHVKDSVVLSKTYKGNYTLISEIEASISSIPAPDILILDISVNDFNPDETHDTYIHNTTEYTASNLINDLPNHVFSTELSGYGGNISAGYGFAVDQLVNMSVTDACSGYEWGATYKLSDISGYGYTFSGNFPEFIIADSLRYDVKASYAFKSFSSMELNVKGAYEDDNSQGVYHSRDYRENFIDDTFVMINILFSQEYSNEHWYDASTTSLSNNFYLYKNNIEVASNNLIILNALYDSSSYMVGQKNMWTIKENISKDIVFTVYNDKVPFVFEDLGYYDVEVSSYDIYGNMATNTYEGLIHVV